MTPTSNNHYLFHIQDLHKRFFALDSSEVRLLFLIKVGAFKAGEIEGAYLASLGNRKHFKIQNCFCSQNIRLIFSL